jgi:hypothetical protein
MLYSFLAQNGTITAFEMLICTLVSIALGLVVALTYMYKNSYSKPFVTTIALLPVIIQSVILLVNGNLGTGVAVAGAFSLIRFRSVPGGAREILTVFFTMAVGLACGMGYLAYAALFTLIVGAASIALTLSGFGDGKAGEKRLRITVPEDLNYTHAFDDIFETFTTKSQLHKVRTTNLGGLYELQYDITLKNTDDEKAMLDQIRGRNGNLTVGCGIPAINRDEL